MMFSLYKKLFCTALFTLLGFAQQGMAATFAISDMGITGGNYMVWDTNGSLVNNPSAGGTVTPLTFFGPDTNLVGGYIGNGGTGTSNLIQDPDSIFGAVWFNQPVNIYTAATNLGDDSNIAGSILGGPVPTGILDDGLGTISMDLSSLFANWGNIDFNQGSSTAAGTWNSVTGAYSMSWSTAVSDQACGPLGPDCVAQWTLSGTANAVSAVPLPAAVWLFGSGLIGIFSIARRKRIA